MFARGTAFKQYHSSILRYKLATLLRCAGRSFLASPRKEPKKATWGRRSDCAVVTLLHFGTTPDSPNSPSPKTPSAQGISSTNQIENLGSHLPRCAKSLYCSSRFCKLFGKFLFDLPCGGRFCPNGCLLSYLVLNVCGLHNFIMVKLRSSRRRIACR